uniref:Beta-1,4-N-acetylgalactosaminyltransferase n=1 Tax=Cyprinus carpio TaxID=7962 RepID=A0A8C1IVC0_CYPCA
MLRFPVKKIRKQFKLLLLLVLLTFAVWFTYLHINQGKSIKLHFNYGKDGERPMEGTDTSRKRDSRFFFFISLPLSQANHYFVLTIYQSVCLSIRVSESNPQVFHVSSSQCKGQANLHVFEDWCGSSVAQLRKNLHFPLYPHTRTTVKKLAVAPKWKNYGLRIFGYILPYKDGDFQFAVSSDDNSEFWLSSDDSPLNARLLAYVGKLGSEWTAPGEFTKFRSQASKSVHLMASRRYYFEILHKQDDKGSDHVEVGVSFKSAQLNSLKMNHVDHIPQTLASHDPVPAKTHTSSQHGADMLQPDPRDTFFNIPMIDPSHLENVLPACLYSPTYVVKDFPIARYQGLQFVYLSFVYPNDFTRLTHMERENKCFYRESPIYLEKFGFYKYMKMDEEEDDRPFFFPNPDGEFSCHPLRPITTARPPPAATPPSANSSENMLPTEPLRVTSYLHTSEITESQQQRPDTDPEPEEDGGLSEYSYEDVEPRPGWAEESINWQRTFSVNSMDFETLRSDWNDLRCNVSGNLQLSESEVVDVLSQYMEKLNERNGGIYTLLRIINVEKRRDSARGNRYLIELELMERGRKVVRLSEYIYLLLHRGRVEDSLENMEGVTASSPSSSFTMYAKPLLCQPVMLQWKKDVMVHFVVPVKNQARWVQQFISDMEFLHRETKDNNFNIIIVDFQSEDMDVEQALRGSSVPRYEYLRREGNFERSAGLQIGVDTIEDSHSIVFLCDLHIHFPLNILENIRKHCVEGKLAFAPIVMRLGCGSSPQEPDGYWEVNGFGLFGIYKSDFDKIGGMNTEEFKDRWGGEDWELLDRVLQNGLEVERLRLRNFFHYYHSKRGMWNSQASKAPKG